MASETPFDVDLLTSLPWPCQARILQLLPLRTCLLLSTVCKQLYEVVTKDVLRRLRLLDLNQLSAGAQVSEALSWAFREDLPSLCSISASGAACLEALKTAFTRPTGTNLSNQLTSLHLDSLKQLQAKHLAEMLPVCNNLEALSLPRCAKLADEAAACIAAHLPRLRVVNCFDWSALTDAGVCALALGCPQLEDVTLDGCLRVGSESLALLARSCPRLRRLSIAKSYIVTDVALAALGEHAKELRELLLRQCPRVAAVGQLGRCSQLALLDLSGCPKVDAAGLRELLAGCGPSLTSLQLNGCVGVAGEALGMVGQLCPGLRAITLRGLALQNRHLRDLAAHCTSLRSLGLAWCTRITDGGLLPLVERNPELRDLDIEALYNLSDSLLAALAVNAPHLSRLCIRMCHRLTPEGIVGLVQATELSSLVVSGILDESGTHDLATRVKRARPTCSLHW